MKKAITGIGIGGYRTLLGICTTYSIVILAVVYTLTIMNFENSTMITSSYLISTILPLLLMTITIMRMIKNYYYAIVGFRISKKYLVLPITHSAVAKFDWSNIKKIYINDNAPNKIFIDVDYLNKDKNIVSTTINISTLKSKHNDSYVKIVKLYEVNKNQLRLKKSLKKRNITFLSIENITLCIIFNLCFYLL